MLDEIGETPQGVRHLSTSLNRMGDLHRSAGDMASAKVAWEESLAIDRRLVETMGETPQGLRDLSVSLKRIGSLHEIAGDMAEAEAAYGESSALRQKLDALSG